MASLYDENSAVTILDDSCFVGTSENYKITKSKNKGAGFIKAYAPWCGHCQSKVNCMNRLAGILSEFGLTVYVLDADENRVFSNTLGVRGYPSFYHVDKDGRVTGTMRTANGEPVGQVYEIIASLCGNKRKICEYIEANKHMMEGCDYQAPKGQGHH